MVCVGHAIFKLLLLVVITPISKSIIDEIITANVTKLISPHLSMFKAATKLENANTDITVKSGLKRKDCLRIKTI